MLLLPATLTAREARDTLRMLRQALQSEAGKGSDEPVVVDASRLQQLDSSALAVLLELDRLARAWGRTFSIRGVPAKLAALARLYGVDTLLTTGAAESEAAVPAA